MRGRNQFHVHVRSGGLASIFADEPSSVPFHRQIQGKDEEDPDCNLDKRAAAKSVICKPLPGSMRRRDTSHHRQTDPTWGCLMNMTADVGDFAEAVGSVATRG